MTGTMSSAYPAREFVSPADLTFTDEHLAGNGIFSPENLMLDSALATSRTRGSGSGLRSRFSFLSQDRNAFHAAAGVTAIESRPGAPQSTPISQPTAGAQAYNGYGQAEKENAFLSEYPDVDDPNLRRTFNSGNEDENDFENIVFYL